MGGAPVYSGLLLHWMRGGKQNAHKLFLVEGIRQRLIDREWVTAPPWASYSLTAQDGSSLPLGSTLSFPSRVIYPSVLRF